MEEIRVCGAFDYRIEIEDSAFRARAERIVETEGLERLCLSLEADQPFSPPRARVSWSLPHRDIQGLWLPTGAARSFPSVWSAPIRTAATTSSPVCCLYASDGNNRLTCAHSDAIGEAELRLALREEDATWRIEVASFATARAPKTRFTLEVRVDTRRTRYEEALSGVSEWWAAMPSFAPRKAPVFCAMPTYSTWYAFHQHPDAAGVLKQARLAAEIGCKSVILDDGWQMEDDSRTYAWCGDWAVCEKEFPDLRGHVDAARALGLRYMVWFALPFVGKRTAAGRRFDRQLLSEVGGAGVLDPRYPDVRSYLIDTCARAAEAWGIDGFKLDFLDCFCQPDAEKPDNLPGRDFDSVGEATACLLDALLERLERARPGMAIEFRQDYVGPLARRCATMLRAADCPGDFLQNKLRTVGIRLLSRGTAAHSDMLLWHPNETDQAVALQLLHVLFSVPQISVRLDEAPAAHREVLAFWLEFWTRHRETLLYGRLRAEHPELGYTLVGARGEANARGAEREAESGGAEREAESDGAPGGAEREAESGDTARDAEREAESDDTSRGAGSETESGGAERETEYITVAYANVPVDLPEDAARVYIANASRAPMILCRAARAGVCRVTTRDCAGRVTGRGERMMDALVELAVPECGLLEVERVVPSAIDRDRSPLK